MVKSGASKRYEVLKKHKTVLVGSLCPSLRVCTLLSKAVQTGETETGFCHFKMQLCKVDAALLYRMGDFTV